MKTKRTEKHYECSLWYSRQASPSNHPGTTGKYFYTLKEKCDVVWLIDNGWHPLDVAVAYGMSVFLRQNGALYSSVYRNYEVWSSRIDVTRANQKTPS